MKNSGDKQDGFFHGVSVGVFGFFGGLDEGAQSDPRLSDTQWDAGLTGLIKDGTNRTVESFGGYGISFRMSASCSE